MKMRNAAAVLCVAVLAAVAWLSGRDAGRKPAARWTKVAPGVFRSSGSPAGYALVAGERAFLLDAPTSADGLKAHGVKKVDAVWLTHHHRDSVAWAGRFLAAKVPVRAPRASAPWLTPAGVRTFWKESIPLRGSRTAYLVLPEGLAGIDCSLADGTTLEWNGWSLSVIATPGHSPDHIAIAARHKDRARTLIFCGDALAAAGKLWSPYTTDWDHWTDAGLVPSAASLRKLARRNPAMLLPAHGPVLARNTRRALARTATAVEEVAFLKSFERYTKERLGDAPKYAFLAREQAGTNGSKPWSKISEHLYLTGNTYVLVSKDNAFLVVDPWDPHSAKQIPKLQAEKKLGKLEVVLCSHAHFDHYDGAYTILARAKPKVWTLDRVAQVVAEPFRLRAPFLDPRPLKIDKRLKDGETARWREYTFKFHFLPGQTEYTMGVETTIDGKKCLFTGDNFFHHDLYSGTGGWMGLNRSGPLMYAASAQKVVHIKPDWVLAEHGSAMEYSAEDFRRRVQWGKVSARAADALCPSGDHRHDWNPHHVRIEPVLQKGKAGTAVKGTLVVDNPLGRKRALTVTLEGRGLTPDQTWQVEVPAGGTVRRAVSVKLGEKVPLGRQVFALRVTEGEAVDGGDAIVAVDVGR
jgi:glyoxylase-like metal-dependent hydrolase (beta-lactamase superfamily II)